MYLCHRDLGEVIDVNDVFVVFKCIVFEFRSHGNSSVVDQDIDLQVVCLDKIRCFLQHIVWVGEVQGQNFDSIRIETLRFDFLELRYHKKLQSIHPLPFLMTK